MFLGRIFYHFLWKIKFHQKKIKGLVSIKEHIYVPAKLFISRHANICVIGLLH
jgi:hypothetical protein